MTRTEHLLLCVAEECAEIAHRVSKALRFGLDEVQPGQPLNNVQRIEQEINDLTAVLIMCREQGIMSAQPDHEAIARKKQKVEEYLLYSARCGTLSEGV